MSLNKSKCLYSNNCLHFYSVLLYCESKSFHRLGQVRSPSEPRRGPAGTPAGCQKRGKGGGSKGSWGMGGWGKGGWGKGGWGKGGWIEGGGIEGGGGKGGSAGDSSDSLLAFSGAIREHDS